MAVSFNKSSCGSPVDVAVLNKFAGLVDGTGFIIFFMPLVFFVLGVAAAEVRVATGGLGLFGVMETLAALVALFFIRLS
jgi:uncharacterized membrane protein YoaK (UPF0700 family)